MTIYQLRYKINKFDFEVKLSTFVPALAYGMRKKLLLEQPAQFHKSKLYVAVIKS